MSRYIANIVGKAFKTLLYQNRIILFIFNNLFDSRACLARGYSTLADLTREFVCFRHLEKNSRFVTGSTIVK